jgi:hypothetical protein
LYDNVIEAVAYADSRMDCFLLKEAAINFIVELILMRFYHPRVNSSISLKQRTSCVKSFFDWDYEQKRGQKCKSDSDTDSDHLSLNDLGAELAWIDKGVIVRWQL